LIVCVRCVGDDFWDEVINGWQEEVKEGDAQKTDDQNGNDDAGDRGISLLRVQSRLSFWGELGV